MSDPKVKAPDAALAKQDAPAPEKSGSGPIGWLTGWVLLPLAFIGALFGGGMLVGAHFHDSWFARSVLWIANLFT